MKIVNFKSVNYMMVAVAFFLLTFLSTSCDQESMEDLTAVHTTSNQVAFRNTGDGLVDYSVAEDILMGINYGDIQFDDQLQALSFSSEESLGNTIDLIKEADAVLRAEIASSIAGLSGGEIDLMEINDYYTFEVFEDHFPGFQSHRAEKAAAEIAFFANDELNDDDDPSVTYGLIPDVLGTVINTFGEVITRDGTQSFQQIHVARKDGLNYTLLDGDSGEQMMLRNEFSYHNDDPSIKIMDDRGGSGGGTTSVKCETNYWKNATKYVTIGDISYRAKLTLGVLNYSFIFFSYHGAVSELRSHKKDLSGGGWTTHTTLIDIAQSGLLYDGGNCDRSSPLTAASASYYTSWRYMEQKTYPGKVSAINQGGASNFVQATFEWKGQTYFQILF